MTPRSYVVRIGPKRVGSVVSQDDVKRLQRDVIAEVASLDAVVLACLTKLPQPTIDQWHAMKNRALSFAGESPALLLVAAQMDAGQAIMKDLAGWHGTLTAAGCTNVPAVPTVTPPSAPLFDFLGQLPPVLLVAGLFLLVRELK